MKEKQELKKQLIILSIVLVAVIGIAIALNTVNRDNESYTKIKDSTSNQNTTQETSVDDFMDRLKGLVEETNTNNENNITNDENKQNTISYENTDIIQLDTGEIVLYSEENQEE